MKAEDACITSGIKDFPLDLSVILDQLLFQNVLFGCNTLWPTVIAGKSKCFLVEGRMIGIGLAQKVHLDFDNMEKARMNFWTTQ